MNEESEKLTEDELIEVLETLQTEADELVVQNINTKPSNEKYEIMWNICQNAWYQAQVRAWIRMTNNFGEREKIVDMDDDVV